MVVFIGLVYSIHDSTEVAIQKMIDASQRMIAVHGQVRGSKGIGLYIMSDGNLRRVYIGVYNSIKIVVLFYLCVFSLG